MLSRISQFDDSSAEIRAQHHHSRNIIGVVDVAMKMFTSCLPRVWPDDPSTEFATMWKFVEYLQIRRGWSSRPSDSLAQRWKRWVLEVWVQLSVRDGKHTTRRFRRPERNPYVKQCKTKATWKRSGAGRQCLQFNKRIDGKRNTIEWDQTTKLRGQFVKFFIYTKREKNNCDKTQIPRNKTCCERTSAFCQHEHMAVGTVAWYSLHCCASLWFPMGDTEGA